jgi:hypothetical protein
MKQGMGEIVARRKKSRRRAREKEKRGGEKGIDTQRVMCV